MPANLPRINEIHESVKALADTLNELLPECADKTATFRHLRQVMMMANDTLLRNRPSDEVQERRPEVFVKAAPHPP